MTIIMIKILKFKDILNKMTLKLKKKTTIEFNMGWIDVCYFVDLFIINHEFSILSTYLRFVWNSNPQIFIILESSRILGMNQNTDLLSKNSK